MFLDEIILILRAGKGGDGIVHFRREKYIPRGGPDGGDGGKGGDVVMVVVPTLNTLSHFRHKDQYQAQDGARGGKNNMTGRSGEDLLVKVPPGTIVINEQTGEILGDLVTSGENLVVCHGGRGGRGNARFATAQDQAPRIAERGEPGQVIKARLELKLIADVGIIGVPNAGKSTLLSAVTNAKPKIAPYPFTTIEPNLGVAILDDETTLIIADIPGLIEGAHLGMGLGHDFLRHIQRTRVLIHLLDGLAENAILDFAQINSELALFDPGLASKPQIVAVNKMDLLEAQENWPKIEVELLRNGHQAIPISAATGINVRKLLYKSAEILAEAPNRQDDLAIPIYRPEDDPREFNITQLSKGWKVSGKAIERAAAMTYWEYDASIRRFQRILAALGVEDALRKAGVREGDSVFIGEYELEWWD
jgi:GTP-binding protein